MLDVGYAVRIGGVLEVGEDWRELERQVLLVVELVLLLLVELGRSWCMQVRVVLRERVVLQESGLVHARKAMFSGRGLFSRSMGLEHARKAMFSGRGLFSRSMGLEERVVLWVGREGCSLGRKD